MSLIEVKLRPTGPWRVGHHAGDRERVDVVYHSDQLYSAVTHAMRALGWLEEWLDVTARASEPVVRFSSLFPFMGKTRLVPPPKSVWPPSNPGKLYLQGAKLVPLEIVKSGVVEEARWAVDGDTECLLPTGVASPFRVSIRTAAAVDRLNGTVEPHRTACLEFAPNAGWWGVFSASDAHWEARVKSAVRLLADSGFGGERSRGWGRASEPQFSEAGHLFAPAGAEGHCWLLSMYSPHEADVVDWSRGEYSAAVRSGWTDSPAGAGAKKQVRLMEEGSVLAAESLLGRAVDVAPDGFAHPVYRSGVALYFPAPLEILVRNQVRQVVAPVVPAVAVEEPVEPPEPEVPEAPAEISVVEPELELVVVEAGQAEPPVPPVEDRQAEPPVPPVEDRQAEPPVPPVEAPVEEEPVVVEVAE